MYVFSRMAGKSDAERVNHLYWETESSVAEIANELNISRRALYELIEPLPTGVECSKCSAELRFANRSAKATNAARCIVCGSERVIDEPVEDFHFEQPREMWPYVVIGAALLGIAATVLFRRRND